MIKITNITTAQIGIQRRLNKMEENQVAERIRDYMIKQNVIGEVMVK
tara:strand:- start:124 stop:264 length:141 start_codon:yes stop_codon:yes gene_type:complete